MIGLVARRTKARRRVAQWLRLERSLYSDPKWHEGDNEANAIGHMETNQEWWFNYVDRYLNQANLQGLDTIQGRQAAAKGLVTLTALVETAVLVHGDLPKPGVTSGEIIEWKDA